MTTKFFVRVEPSYSRKGALDVCVNIQCDEQQSTRRLTIEDRKSTRGLFTHHANLLTIFQTCDPSPDIEVEEGHFMFTFGWIRETGQHLLKHCRKCQAITNHALFGCPRCDEPLPQAGA